MTAKTPTPEELVNGIFGAFLTGLGEPTDKQGPKPTPTVDNVAEINRLLKKAEETEYGKETQELLQIADRHIKLVELALGFQK